MFNVLTALPLVISSPPLADGAIYEFELAAGVDVSMAAKGALLTRVHSAVTGSNLQVTVRAYSAWPFDLTGERFQAASAVLTSAVIDSGTAAGALVTSGAPAELGAAMLRIVVRFTASGDNAPAEDITLSVGLLLPPS
ncbi:MAG TPA: hypothetical protein PLR99_09945 [Polyangiaceae bacterium]|nr:hypothetical protein [Polyangiaceae bacterium]